MQIVNAKMRFFYNLSIFFEEQFKARQFAIRSRSYRNAFILDIYQIYQILSYIQMIDCINECISKIKIQKYQENRFDRFSKRSKTSIIPLKLLK
ncbi:hypothetical protein TTHERM_000678336 (macronuclear) [Tetrahymena thermophila SB210]|uniref:Uncharacterized protein n=1 Tax=Tetrahymena thermophila (strain SB210) TaxID=312017 RepID=W7XDV2_TETTS|nr:hypothetical protein TTHERM_000678336 [Tetrahymena thermophila SB210]EWS70994.1 hypothetical protein TTHERM_000678336 [Tetrahymena thermophila SB210]|eukprot:XP_012656478.1 hypothetical protein TTHERM_000678336 [Tetrahymena thermophila SB210]